jgi:cytochrome b involved in lipid metabolism
MKYKNIIVLTLIVLSSGFIFSGCLPGATQDEAVVEEIKTVPDVSYSLKDLAGHNTKDNCWQAISGVVYDFTPYLADDKHPGGNAMAKDCGTDATFRYDNDPEHSDYAKSLLPEYAIGKLVVAE